MFHQKYRRRWALTLHNKNQLRLFNRTTLMGVSTCLRWLVLLLILTGHSATAQTPHETFGRLFNDYAQQRAQFAVGASLAIDGQDPVILVSGNTTINSDVAVGRSQPWHIGSITKSFTATVIMRLVERGMLNLDAPIGGYLDPYVALMHEDWQALTLRQLLSHTSGIPANPSILSFWHRRGEDTKEARAEALGGMWHRSIRVQNGRYKYSNMGYVLAGMIAEQVTGQSWQMLLKTEIVGPLNLDTLGFGPPLGADVAWGHRNVLGRSVPQDPAKPKSDNPSWMGPAGLLHLSLADLVRWGQAHLRACDDGYPGFLTVQSCKMMRSPGDGDYGFGWKIQQLPDTDLTLVWHNGSNTRWYTMLAMVPERDIVIAIAMNTFRGQVVDDFVMELVTELTVEPH